MAELSKGLRMVLSKPKVYDLFQRLMGSDKAYKEFSKIYITPKSGDRILDVGCGTATILKYLKYIEYVGIDINTDYINVAREKYGELGLFICDTGESNVIEGLAPFDTVLMMGVAHHLDNDSLSNTFSMIKKVLKDNGKLITIDPTFTPDQNLFAKLLIKLDRGLNVRSPEEYFNIANSIFSRIKIQVSHKKFIPYTHCIISCRK